MSPSPQIILENLKLRFGQRSSNNPHESAHTAFFHTIEHYNGNYSNFPAEIETAAFKAQAPAQSSNQGQGVQRQTKRAPGNAPGTP
jgi:hypothetical protein